MIVKALAAVAVLLLVACAPTAPSMTGVMDCLQFSDGWMREPVAGHAMSAGYGTLHNRCDHVVEIAVLGSPQAQVVELHRSDIVDGVSRMRPVDVLTVQPGEQQHLQPGGLHLMFHGVDGGQTVEETVLVKVYDGLGVIQGRWQLIRRSGQ